SASAMSETVQELGLAAGVALVGSLVGAVYTAGVRAAIPAGLPADAARAVEGSLADAVSVADRVPEPVLAQAEEAFVAGLNTAGWIGAAVVLALAGVAAVALRGVGAAPEGEPAGGLEAAARRGR